MTLPPLPEPEVMWVDGKDQWGYDAHEHAFSADQVRTYALAALAQQPAQEPVATVIVMGSYRGNSVLGCLIDPGVDVKAGDKLYAAPVAQPAQEPVAWAQLGMLNGRTYVRMHYEGPIYPPSPDVVRNLNLVPLYAAPQQAAAAPARQPLTKEQIDRLRASLKPAYMLLSRQAITDIARAIERAHGIGGAV